MPIWPRSFKSKETQFGEYVTFCGQDIYGHNKVTDFFYAYWSGLCESGHKPTRPDIKPIDIKQFLDRVVLLDISEYNNNMKLTVRLIGTHISAFYGEIAGHDVRSMDNAEAAERIYSICEQVKEDAEAVMSITNGIAQDKVYLQAYALYMPLFNGDGDVHKIIACVDIQSEPR